MTPHRKTRRVTALSGVLAALALAGCGGFSPVGLDLFGAAEEPSSEDCPTFGRLKDADRLIRFTGAPGDPADVAFEATITDIAAVCDVDDDEIEVSVGMRVTARPGPAWDGRPMPLEAVIAHTSGPREVLFRETRAFELSPEPGRTSAFADFAVEYEIGYRSRSELGDDTIALGLKLTRSELRYLRSLRGR